MTGERTGVQGSSHSGSGLISSGAGLPEARYTYQSVSAEDKYSTYMQIRLTKASSRKAVYNAELINMCVYNLEGGFFSKKRKEEKRKKYIIDIKKIIKRKLGENQTLKNEICSALTLIIYFFTNDKFMNE